MQRWERFYLDSRHVGYQQLEVRQLSGPILRTASLTVFRIGGGTNLSGFFFDSSPDNPLAWTAFGSFSAEGPTTYVRDGATVVCAGNLVSEIPDDTFPGQMFLPLCQSMESALGATRTYVMIGDGDGQLAGRATLEIVNLEAPLPDGTQGSFVHVKEQVAGSPARQFYVDKNGQLVCSVWGPGCWSLPVDSRIQATEGCDPDWPTLERLWPEG